MRSDPQGGSPGLRGRTARLLSVLGPGILVAATGVGAGDLATGALTGSKLGVAVLWAVIFGAGLKFVLNEGLARRQLVTGDTLLEGCVERLGRPVQHLFFLYLVFWSFFVGSALMSACGVAAHALLPILDAGSDKVAYGLIHSAVAVVLVRRGGFQLFERVMGICIAVMFVTVVATAVAVQPSWPSILAGALTPNIPDLGGQGLPWTLALMGGVGGTVTVLCYGYWIREVGRSSPTDLRTCRIDLAAGYTMTALFGMAMVVLGSTIQVEGKGARLLVQLSDQLQHRLGDFGPLAKWAFLIGAWGAIFSSLLGVWQSVPYLFTDFWSLRGKRTAASPRPTVSTDSAPYRTYLYALATVPALGLWASFQIVQRTYAIVGAAFIPLLATALLVLNGRTAWIGRKHRNRLITTLILATTVALFLLAAFFQIRDQLS